MNRVYRCLHAHMRMSMHAYINASASLCAMTRADTCVQVFVHRAVSYIKANKVTKIFKNPP